MVSCYAQEWGLSWRVENFPKNAEWNIWAWWNYFGHCTLSLQFLMVHLISSMSIIKDPFAKSLAWRIQCLSVQIGTSRSCITNNYMKPVIWNNNNLVVHPHCSGNFYLEWRRTYPLLEEDLVVYSEVQGMTELKIEMIRRFCWVQNWAELVWCIRSYLYRHIFVPGGVTWMVNMQLTNPWF